jgi:hypothetical protein
LRRLSVSVSLVSGELEEAGGLAVVLLQFVTTLLIVSANLVHDRPK